MGLHLNKIHYHFPTFSGR